ncbi:hypothetical protein LIER_37645 [Lithospermum erythrorhizon]|uniref:F-box associated beta-propeller type 3 domain-containing protein n=1 Tax=Lithospermum erythrorhizon TaxID=34254 RepID=A0AAV3PNG4_LITER
MGISFWTGPPSSSGGIISMAPPFQGTSNRLGVASCGISKDLLWEVLVCLPTKSFMRFKCISKLWYYIGFDPVKEVYKVLNFTLYYDFDGDNGVGDEGIDYHVFTLGIGNSDMEWRNIVPPPLKINFVQCLCINGVIYWMSCNQKTLATLHLDRETFETIDLSPECTGGVNLVEICGSIALVAFNYSEHIVQSDVWTMNTHCRGGDIETWTRKRILLPNSLNYAFTSWNYEGTLPTGEMMLVLTTGERELDNHFYMLI